MIQQCYINGLEKQSFECLGLQLQPLTLGHVWLLMTLESPLLENDEDMNFADLSVAAFVCGHETYIEAKSELENATEESFAAWGETCDIKNIGDERKLFKTYLDYYTEAPMRNDENSGYSKCPWPWLYSWILLRDGVVKTQTEAWNTICSDAFAWNACRCAYSNDENLMNDLEVDFYLSE